MGYGNIAPQPTPAASQKYFMFISALMRPLRTLALKLQRTRMEGMGIFPNTLMALTDIN